MQRKGERVGKPGGSLKVLCKKKKKNIPVSFKRETCL